MIYMLSVRIILVGGKEVNLNSNQVDEISLANFITWFESGKGNAVNELGYITNRTTFRYLFKRDNIAYIEAIES